MNQFADEQVVLIHGLGAHRWLLTPLQRTLRKIGYQTRNYGYTSVIGDIEDHASRFAQFLYDLQSNQPPAATHVVAHSMGAVVARRALQLNPQVRVHRLVMLCPPNRGSHVARRLAKYLGRFSYPLKQLSDEAGSYVNQLEADLPGDCQVAILRATNDFVIPPLGTELPGVVALKTIDGLHTSILFKNETKQAVARFLATGQL